MEIITEQNGNALSMHLTGRVDTITSAAFEKAVDGLPAEITDLVLDMKGVEYVSSAGLRVLLGAQKLMNKRGSMKLVNVCETVMDVLEMTGFVDILDIE